ncbi:Lrp/AsnC family transcriptional regulator [Dongia deserti]|uniref:Lrp/AsnC family transcriptional regulator n=1 Tax=Dongia deserti TaxID=2268030 RepID=UPI000E6593E7|nr:Lrp/AsnC family transcriptional regulator [Dongia deserti]
MDDIDRIIIDRLQEDGALTYAEIGAAAGLSPSAVNDRLKRLRAEGVIRRMTAEIDPAAIGLGLLAFVLVAVNEPESEVRFREAMKATPEVLECHHLTGDFSYLLKLRLRDTAHLEHFLMDRLKPLSGIVRTHTLIALSSVKETHILSASLSGAVHA